MTSHKNKDDLTQKMDEDNLKNKPQPKIEDDLRKKEDNLSQKGRQSHLTMKTTLPKK